VVEDGTVESGQGERRAEALTGIVADPEDLKLAGEAR
jgi:hypothetical protein